jgi:hypothetical protein
MFVLDITVESYGHGDQHPSHGVLLARLRSLSRVAASQRSYFLSDIR